MSSPAGVDDEKLAHDAIQPVTYSQLATPASAVQSSDESTFSYQTLATPAHHTHIEERKEATSDIDKLPTSTSVVAFTEPIKTPATTISDLPSTTSGSHFVAITKQNSSFTQPPAVAQPCPGQQYWGTWRHPSLLYFGWLTPLIRLGIKRPLQFDDLWQTFDAEKADVIWV